MDTIDWYAEGIYAGQEFHGFRDPMDPYTYFGIYCWNEKTGNLDRLRDATPAEQRAIDLFLDGVAEEQRAVDNRHAWASAPI